MILFSLWVVILSKPLKAETDLTELDQYKILKKLDIDIADLLFEEIYR